MLASTVQTPTLQTYLRPDLQHLFYSHLPSFWKGSCQPCAKWIPVFPKYTAAGMKWGRTFGSQSLGCFASATVQWKQPDFGVWPFFRYEDCVCFRHCYLDFAAVRTWIRSSGVLPMLLFWKGLLEQMGSKNGIWTPPLLSYGKKRA